jgi:glycosyltransferase involved in cell wall biosynthesis
MGAPSARVYELSRHWAKRGFNVTVLTGFPHHPTGKIPHEYRQHFFKRDKIDKINVVRTYVFPTANKGFIKRIYSYMSFMISSVLLGSWTVGNFDVIIATSPQFFVAVAGYFISKMKNRPFILEIRDLWPESIVQLGQLKNKTIIKLLEFVEVFLYNKSSAIVVVAESSIPLLNRKGISSLKIKVIKNGVDINLFNPNKVSKNLKEKLGLRDKFIVSYIGTHGLSHALDKVLESAKILQGKHNIHFLLIGEGAEKSKLIKLARRMQLNNVSFIDQIDKHELPFYYSLSDVVLVTLRKLDLFQCVIPSKVFEIMAMAKPILSTVDGEARNLVVDQAESGIFVESENPQAMATEIIKLSLNMKECLRLGKNGYDFVRVNYDRSHLADQYMEYLEEIYIQSKPRLTKNAAAL